jgi:hypothetical protein
MTNLIKIGKLLWGYKYRDKEFHWNSLFLFKNKLGTCWESISRNRTRRKNCKMADQVIT